MYVHIYICIYICACVSAYIYIIVYTINIENINLFAGDWPALGIVTSFRNLGGTYRSLDSEVVCYEVFN